ncbi:MULTISPECIES: phosphotransferase [unclassified Paenibacillus]|uniref:Phosphotransferase enzyme family protein n=1 Tax=Paenibacillus provencensis TaxID=441151 RepID=A0ABW3PPX5_9BACL|nr:MULTISPECIES: phosphotransferase [unclassified Paenibacillus]MCM3126410.1 phosphotransferase [Paenibacillus sp. MER 78]SFS60382.1 Ser/Thr protein kinase RdoA involved in Cpx stress response, MazF antagonist [Paenibacillus sp. 453mf]
MQISEGFLLRSLEEHYEIGEASGLVPISSGHTSHACRLETMQGHQFVLRRLRSKLQAACEYEISSTAAAHYVTPYILPGRNENGFIEVQGNVYNLQHYLKPDKVPVQHMFLQMGKALGILHTVLRNTTVHDQEDRFSLEYSWNEATQNMSDNLNASLEKYVTACLEMNQRMEGCIHADLGIWNVIFHAASVYIIDFGEARTGDYHFDAAALLTSSIGKAWTDQQAAASIFDFKKGYEQSGLQLDQSVLLENMILWLIRGAATVLAEYGETEQTTYYVDHIIADLTKYNRLLG